MHEINRSCFCISFILSLLPAITFAQSQESLKDSERVIASTEERMTDGIRSRTNRFRRKKGLRDVQMSEKLQQAATEFAEYMARTKKYGHTADGQQPSERAAAAGYEYCIVLENIAYRFQSRDLLERDLGKMFFRGWKQSPGHRENLLDPDITETGIGVAFGDSESSVFAVQMFGRPRSLQLQVNVENRLRETVRLEVSSGDSADTIELPARSRLQLTRCRPTNLKLLDDTEPGSDEPIQLTTSATLRVSSSTEGKSQLVRVDQ